jgi:hypothetical protein
MRRIDELVRTRVDAARQLRKSAGLAQLPARA